MNNEDKAAEKMANLVLDVYRYALDNKMDIMSHEDVVKILTVLEVDSSDEIDVNTLIEGLVALDLMTKAEVEKRKEPARN